MLLVGRLEVAAAHFADKIDDLAEEFGAPATN